eukprot:CAMPEP_0177643142 /NCGR_PEP_ID=MMETSP0447-20121125/7998_1 /TAXON_ID=0 /ORGANISM="Stygamoeba regulata, Strain BSH-02190019" /LENGTH=351 /DNA_ID=CAMNT_0019145419 /DNA_START=49 /DNA_END=1104 /DNA_ORIENTATION=-
MAAAAPTTTKTIRLKCNLDAGAPTREHFNIEETPAPVLDSSAAGAILVQALVFSADPFQRGQLRTGRGKSAGDVMTGFIAGKVLQSNNDKWAVGDLFGASLPFSTVQVVTSEELSATTIWKLTGVITEDQISLGVGILGMPGSTAYGGLIDILQPKAGQTLFVSAASGAVGSLVGQIGKKVYGCKVVGSCGGPDKCAIVKDKFGFDASVDYKLANNSRDALAAQLKEVAPEGVDMYFENVGGIHFDVAFAALRRFGRIAVCGAISGYNEEKPPANEVNIGAMIYSFQRIEGFMCSPWLSGQKGNFLEDMAKWWREGKLQVQETFFEGVEAWPDAFNSLFTGKNLGKVVVRV